jgi:hypothetical protein
VLNFNLASYNITTRRYENIDCIYENFKEASKSGNVKNVLKSKLLPVPPDTAYIHEIDGNKFLVEDKGITIFLDFV